MWPFSRCKCSERLRDLRQEQDQADDAYSGLLQSKCAAEAAMHRMQKATTDQGISEIAKGVTAQIADIYAAGGHGVRTRDIAVHTAVAAAVRRAVRGESHWNERGLAAAAQGASQ